MSGFLSALKSEERRYERAQFCAHKGAGSGRRNSQCLFVYGLTRAHKETA